MAIQVGEATQIDDVAKELAAKAKAYFSKQYTKSDAPVLSEMFAATSTIVNSKPLYVQVQARRYAAMRNAFGWPAAQDTSTDIGKWRYLETIQSLIAIYI
jgi:hypothetical protein